MNNFTLGRDVEEPAREAFSRWIEEMDVLRAEQIWEKVEDNNEPPDYFLAIAGKKFAIEVTCLVDGFGSNDSARTFPAIEEHSEEFRRFVEPPLNNICPLHHEWLVDLMDVPCRSEWASQKRAIEDAIRLCEETPPPLNRSLRFGNFFVLNCGQDQGIVEVCFSHGSWTVAEALEILRRALEEKARKLTKVQKPWILLCWSAGLLVQKRDYMAIFEFQNSPDSATRNAIISAACQFASVLIINEAGVDLLYGKRQFWK
jgi:hypothetical protein